MDTALFLVLMVVVTVTCAPLSYVRVAIRSQHASQRD